MAGNKHITAGEAQRVWYLHKKGLNAKDIEVAIDRSKNSILRVIDIFTRAEAGEWEALENDYKDNHKNILSIAREYFGVDTVQETPAQTEKQPAHDNTAKFAAEVLTELRRNNELLQQLISIWG
jgi:hypothetical protein